MATKVDPQIAQALTGQAGPKIPGFAGDIVQFLFGGDSPDASGLIAPIGMAKFITSKSGITKKLSEEVTHENYIKKMFGVNLHEFIQKGGIRGSEDGLDYAVNKAGKSLVSKEAENSALTQLVENATQNAKFTNSDPLESLMLLEKIEPDKHRTIEETTLKELLKYGLNKTYKKLGRF